MSYINTLVFGNYTLWCSASTFLAQNILINLTNKHVIHFILTTTKEGVTCLSLTRSHWSMNRAVCVGSRTRLNSSRGQSCPPDNSDQNRGKVKGLSCMCHWRQLGNQVQQVQNRGHIHVFCEHCQQVMNITACMFELEMKQRASLSI